MVKIKKSKKAQLLGQPFIYIFAIIVAALVLVFGTKAILDLKEKQELAELTTFVTKLKEDVAAYYRFDIGSSKELNLNLPRKVKKVCFTENKLEIFPKVFFLNEFKIPYLKPVETPLCIDTNGKLKAIIETKPRYVEIRRIT